MKNPLMLSHLISSLIKWLSRSHSLSMLVRAVLLDKKPEEVPLLVESVLNMEEFEHRVASQGEQKMGFTIVFHHMLCKE
ncbi:kinesin-like protein KIN-14Q [Vigna radiata var. radiata]|uniref:Kinesin-like protein KIN-14Q n=1 Tax=Vigna radiata var. radiata TaxID=3916 RepID=A0A1S3V267_VIGRR|nr:kinesin-like protein KIN-14Q [Vigna radiata var. radiata]